MYRTVPTYRRGRTYYSETGERGGLAGFCSILLVLCLLIIPIFVTIASESYYKQQLISFMELLDGNVLTLTNEAKQGDLVHANLHAVDVFSTDDKVGIVLPEALTLKRQTEYCQWTEIRSETCETCYREVEARDGSRSREEYPCNCVTTYDYVKSWMPHLVPSFFHDQFAAHHNPQRDPLPSRTFAAEHATFCVNDDENVKVSIDEWILLNVRSKWRKVDWVPGGVPKKPSVFSGVYWGLWSDTNRYEAISELGGTRSAPAAVNDNFVYVGQGGYFFSPYVASRVELMMKYFFEYLEGSLMDWQLGDLMPSCTAGDIRISYAVQDPSEVSVLAMVKKRSKDGNFQLTGYRTPSGQTIGLLHGGVVDPQTMILTEKADTRKQMILPRLLMLIWSAATAHLFGAFVGISISRASAFSYLSAVVAVWFTGYGLLWAYLYCGDERFGCTESTELLGAAGLFIYWAIRHTPTANVPGSLNAVWCMIGRWARVPPSWRVETSYISEGKTYKS